MENLLHESGVDAAVPAQSADEGFRALTIHCGVTEPVSRARIKLSGKDRVRWLNGMITNNIRDLAPGRGVYAFLLNPQGRIQGDLYAYQHPDFLLLDTDQNQLEGILALFRRYIIMDKVELADVTAEFSVLQIAGKNAAACLAAAGFPIPDLAPLQFFETNWDSANATVIRGDIATVPSFEVWSAPATGAQLQKALIRGGAAEVSAASLELLRIASGIPRFGQDIRDRDLPQETEQSRALNFAKGCYIGQEIVERIRSRGNVHRTFKGFLLGDNLPSPGTSIEIDGKTVGEVTSVAALPMDAKHQNLALGYIRREFAEPGSGVLIGGAPAKVSSLPFLQFFPH